MSYLPLSHIAAQMVDIWIALKVGAVTYFAQPDALKVNQGMVSDLGQQGAGGKRKVLKVQGKKTLLDECCYFFRGNKL